MAYYVYAWLDTRKRGKFKYSGVDHVFDFEPYYVGKGSGRRYRHHLYSKRNLKKYNRSRKILSETGCDPEIVILRSDMTNLESLEFEKKVIRSIGRADISEGTLVNLTDGGDGGVGYKHTKAHKKKMSKIMKGRPNTWGDKISSSLKGKPKSESHKKNLWENRDRSARSEKTKAKIRDAMRERVRSGEHFTEEHRSKISKSVSGTKHPMYGLTHTDETKKKIMPKRIKNFIREIQSNGIKVTESSYNRHRKTGLPKWNNLSKYLNSKFLISIALGEKS